MVKHEELSQEGKFKDHSIRISFQKLAIWRECHQVLSRVISYLGCVDCRSITGREATSKETGLIHWSVGINLQELNEGNSSLRPWPTWSPWSQCTRWMLKFPWSERPKEFRHSRCFPDLFPTIFPIPSVYYSHPNRALSREIDDVTDLFSIHTEARLPIGHVAEKVIKAEKKGNKWAKDSSNLSFSQKFVSPRAHFWHSLHCGMKVGTTASPIFLDFSCFFGWRRICDEFLAGTYSDRLELLGQNYVWEYAELWEMIFWKRFLALFSRNFPIRK